jgi:WD40 repeat protein
MLAEGRSGTPQNQNVTFLVAAFLKGECPAAYDALERSLMEKGQLPTSINPMTGQREPVSLREKLLPLEREKQLESIIAAAANVAAAVNNSDNTSASPSSDLTGTTSSIVNVLKGLLEDPRKNNADALVLVDALFNKHRLERLLRVSKASMAALEKSAAALAKEEGVVESPAMTAAQPRNAPSPSLPSSMRVPTYHNFYRLNGSFGLDLKQTTDETTKNSTGVFIERLTTSKTKGVPLPSVILEVNGVDVKNAKLAKVVAIIRLTKAGAPCEMLLGPATSEEAEDLGNDDSDDEEADVPQTPLAALYYRINQERRRQMEVTKHLALVEKTIAARRRVGMPPQRQRIYGRARDRAYLSARWCPPVYGSATVHPSLVRARRHRPNFPIAAPPTESHTPRHVQIDPTHGVVDQTERFFHARRFQCLKVLNGHLCEPVYNVRVDRSGQFVFTGSDDALIKCWSLITGNLLYTIRGHRSSINYMQIDYGNKYMASVDNTKLGEVRVHMASTGAVEAVLTGHKKVINALEFDIATNCLVTVSDDGHARVWHESCWVDGGWHVEMDKNQVEGATTSSAMPGTTLHAAQQQARVFVGPEVVALPHEHPETSALCDVMCMGMSPTGHYFATGSDQDFTTRIWSLETTERRLGKRGHSKGATYIYKSPRKKVTVRLVNILTGHMKGVSDVLFSNRGERLLTSAEKGNVVRVYDFDASIDGYERPTHKVLKHATFQETVATGASKMIPVVTKVVWSQCDTRILSAQAVFHSAPNVPRQEQKFSDVALLVWDSFTGKLLHRIRAHARPVYVLNAHPFNPRLLFSSGWDGRVVVSDVYDGNVLFMSENKFRRTSLGIPNPLYKEGSAVEILDGAWGWDGMTLQAVDDNGRLLLFGMGDTHSGVEKPKRLELATDTAVTQNAKKYASKTFPLSLYDLVPEEQYQFQDYKPLAWDKEGFVIDTDHDRAPHLVPKRVNVLIGADTQPYMKQPLPYRPHLTDTAEAWITDEDIAKTMCVSDGPKPVGVERERRKARALLDSVRGVRRMNTSYSKRVMAEKKDAYVSGPYVAALRLRGKGGQGGAGRKGRGHGGRGRTGSGSSVSGRTHSRTGGGGGGGGSSSISNGGPRRPSARPTTAPRSPAHASEPEPDDENDSDFNGDQALESSSSEEEEEELEPAAPVRSSRRLCGNSRPNYAAFDAPSDVDEDEDDVDAVDTEDDVVLKEASYGQRDGVIYAKDWLLHASRGRTMAQPGESIVFLPEIYADHLAHLAPSGSSAPRSDKKPQGRFHESWAIVCTVKGISYQFPPTGAPSTVLAKVTLQAVEYMVTTRRDTEYANKLTRRPFRKKFSFPVYVGDVAEPDFLIRSDRFFASILEQQSLVGAEVHVPYAEGEFAAIVQGRSTPASNFPGSLVGVLHVCYETGEEEFISPWEIVLPDLAEPKLSSSTTKRFLAAIDELAAEDRFGLFLDRVDEDIYPLYAVTVCLPMWLGLIRSRLRSSYYRTVEAVGHDASVIHDAAAAFNAPNSQISKDARILRDKIQAVVDSINRDGPALKKRRVE